MKKIILSAIFFFLLISINAQLKTEFNGKKYGLYKPDKSQVLEPVYDTIMRFTIGDSTGIKNAVYIGVKGKISYELCDEIYSIPVINGTEFMMADSLGNISGPWSEIMISYRLPKELGSQNTFATSINGSKRCTFAKFEGMDFTALFFQPIVVVKGGRCGLISAAPGLKAITKPEYDTIYTENYQANYFTCLTNGKYDYYSAKEKKINNSPADTLYVFEITRSNEPTGKALFVVLTGSSKKSISRTEFVEAYDFDPYSGEEALRRLMTVKTFPLTSGGSMSLYDEKFNKLADGVNDLGLTYPKMMHGEDFDPAVSDFHFLSQTDTSLYNSRDGFYSSNDLLYRVPLISINKSGYKFYMLDPFREVEGVSVSEQLPPALRSIGDLFIIRSGNRLFFINEKGVLNKKLDYDDIGQSNSFYADDSVRPRYNYVISVAKNKKWGLISDKGLVIIPAQYEVITSLRETYYLVNKGGTKKYLDYSGQTNTFNYDAFGNEIDTVIHFTGRDSFMVGGKWGLFDNKGKQVIPVAYDYINFDGTDKFVANKGGKEREIAMAYENVPDKSEWADPLEYYEKPTGGTNFIFDLDGKKVSEGDGDYKELYSYNAEEKVKKFIRLTKKGKAALVNEDKKIIIPLQYDKIYINYPSSYDYNFTAVNKDKAVLFAPDGKEIFSGKYGMIAPLEKYYVVSEKGSDDYFCKPGYGTGTNTIIHRLVFKMHDGALLSKDGKVLENNIDSISDIYSEDGYPSGDLMVYKNGNLGLIMKDAAYVPATFKNIKRIPYYNAYTLNSATQNAIATPKGLVVKPLGDSLILAKDNVVYFKHNGRWGIISGSGKELSAAQWDPMKTYFSRTNIEVKKNNKIGIVNSETGEQFIPAEYDSLYHMSDYTSTTLVLAYKNGKTDIFNYDLGKKMNASLLDELKEETLFGNYRLIRSGTNYGLVDSSGKAVLEANYNSLMYGGDVEILRTEKNGKFEYFDKNFSLMNSTTAEEKWKKSILNQVMASSSKKIEKAEWISEKGPFGCDATTFMIDKDGTWWLGTGSSGGVFISKDKGKSWTDMYKGMGPVHVTNLEKINDTIFVSAALPGRFEFSYPQNNYSNYYKLFFLTKGEKEWKELKGERAAFISESLKEIRKERIDKLSGLFQIGQTPADFDPNRENETMYVFKMNKATQLITDTIKALVPSDFTTGYYPVYEVIDTNSIALLCRSGIYVADFKKHKLEKCGTKGLLATDVTAIYPGKNQEVTITSGTYSVWKKVNDKWTLVGDTYENLKRESFAKNEIDYSRFNFNQNGDAVFVAEGSVYKLSAGALKPELIYKPDVFGDKLQTAYMAGWKNKNEVWFVPGSRYGYGNTELGTINLQTKKVSVDPQSGMFKDVRSLHSDGKGETWLFSGAGFFNVNDSAGTLLPDFKDWWDAELRWFYFGDGNILTIDNGSRKMNIWNNALRKWMPLRNLGTEIPTAVSMDNSGRIFVATNYNYEPGGCGSNDTYKSPARFYYLYCDGKTFEPVEIENKINPRVIS
ncbi:MAG: WG repeat-containing protein, partial [Bacteroidia bacterium]|nr:WG repeat-containing protein [Bacteroidia bacterium]